MRIAVAGLGPIGLSLVEALSRTPPAPGDGGLELVAVCDAAPALAGRRLDEILPGASSIASTNVAPIVIDRTLAATLDRDIEAVALCTSSRLEAIAGDLARAAVAGVHVVSSCEELSAPPAGGPLVELWQHLDDDARLAGVTFVGTGVNPGFVMDRLVLQVAGACVRVDGVQVDRTVDAALRREPLRRKVGYGLTLAEFRRGVDEGRLGHVGLRASAALIARGLGSALEGATEEVDAVTGEVAGGAERVLGVRQRLDARLVDGRRVELRLQMSVGADAPHDRIRIEGDPPVDLRIEGGMHGDRATVGALLDALRRLRRAPRGLITVAELY